MARIQPIVERLGPPLSKVPWSPRFVAHNLEILIVCRRDEQLVWLKPVHADTLRLGLAISEQPGDAVLRALEWYDLDPLVVHSTSWRHDGGRVVLNYIAIVALPEALPPDSLTNVDVKRIDLARGGALRPPSAINVEQILEHALRHVAWLIRDDPVIGAVLADWGSLLGDYDPEPFRAIA